MAGKIRIRKAEGTWVVRAGGAVLGESDRALEVEIDGREPRIYFPRDGIAMIFLDASGKTAETPGLGQAAFYSIVTKSTVLKDAAWSYEAPPEDAAQIAGYLAFETGDTVAVERV